MKNICVYCGANPGREAAYLESARELGTYLVKNHYRLIYGGGCVGMMGALADSVITLGGEIIGVVPSFFRGGKALETRISDIRFVPSLNERKSLMMELADAFIALPGGLGTIDEIVDVWTEAQLGAHRKPFGFLNIKGYFDPFLSFLDKVLSEGFMEHEYRNLPIIEEKVNILVELLKTSKIDCAPRRKT